MKIVFTDGGILPKCKKQVFWVALQDGSRFFHWTEGIIGVKEKGSKEIISIGSLVFEDEKEAITLLLTKRGRTLAVS